MKGRQFLLYLYFPLSIKTIIFFMNNFKNKSKYLHIDMLTKNTF
jgi:hypothetical protein